MQTAELLRKVRRLEIRSRHLVEDLFAGRSSSVFKGRGVEFEEVRPYVPGDEVRDIDWNVTARFGAPYVKRFLEERELTVMLVVDASRSMQTVSNMSSGFRRHVTSRLFVEVSSFISTTIDCASATPTTRRTRNSIESHRIQSLAQSFAASE